MKYKNICYQCGGQRPPYNLTILIEYMANHGQLSYNPRSIQFNGCGQK